MNGFNGTVAPPGGMYVRALYDYDADDRTSLSFRQGDIIQVITQLESGWWDGVINGVRGWFPSNYCAVVPRPSDDGEDERNGGDMDDDQDTQSLGGTDYTNSDTESINANDTSLPIERNEGIKEEEAAFWIPQATPDGRLFYFNTLTGVSTMELPLETSTANDSGPRERINPYIPDQSRPPPEFLVGGGYNVEDTDDETSASDFEGPGMSGSQSSLVCSASTKNQTIY
jgi:son of sevenless-like protein